MKKSLIWVISVIITLGAAVYQRLTGPTYPETYKIGIGDQVQKISLPTSHGGETDKRISIEEPEPAMEGFIVFRRFPTNEAWDTIFMQYEEDYLTGYLPHQPPAGKLEYQLILKADTTFITVNEQPVIIRFRGNVPGYVLIPHILFIFAAMLFSTVTGIFAICNYSRYRVYAWVTLFLLITGGLILGPVIQKFAFGDFWTGFPFGKDLTDNKILIAFIFWLAAIIANLKKERRWIIIVAALIYFIINIIPHSLFGSELDYTSGKVVTGIIMHNMPIKF
ncbi:MAG: hypothetical protein AMS27_10955 [Bacteroides sp. SM23_62_1]|nr:MAG: hypothetical protein AMS27_10955 [Bacteroides sp. SM23_62_1]